MERFFILSLMDASEVAATQSSHPQQALPEDVGSLHAQVRHYESELTERDAVIAEHEALIEHLQEQVRLLLARRFAPSSEKIPDG